MTFSLFFVHSHFFRDPTFTDPSHFSHFADPSTPNLLTVYRKMWRLAMCDQNAISYCTQCKQYNNEIILNLVAAALSLYTKWNGNCCTPISPVYNTTKWQHYSNHCHMATGWGTCPGVDVHNLLLGSASEFHTSTKCVKDC